MFLTHEQCFQCVCVTVPSVGARCFWVILCDQCVRHWCSEHVCVSTGVSPACLLLFSGVCVGVCVRAHRGDWCFQPLWVSEQVVSVLSHMWAGGLSV